MEDMHMSIDKEEEPTR